MGNEIVIKTIWSDIITPQEKRDFRYVENEVFGDFCTEFFFKAKYEDNIYGPSVIVIAYLDGRPVGADALWRNDIGKTKAYQSADTCVLSSCRGKGIFTKMVNAKVAVVEEDSLIYGFPNTNSFPGFVKMGWKVTRLYKTFFFSNSQFSKEQQLTIDVDYASWWLNALSGIGYVKKGNTYYLIRKHVKKPIGKIIGTTDRSIALTFPEINGCLLFTWYSKTKSFYNNNKSIPCIFYKKEDNDVPFWKIDAI